MSLLQVDHLTVTLPGPQGPVTAVRDVSFALERGRMLGIVGESGSGKTMTALALMGLLPEGAGVEGAIRLEGQDIARLPEAELCKLRGDRVAMIFQEPMTALNPLQTVGRQVAEPLVLHRGMSWEAARAEAARLLDHVRLPDPKGRLSAFPHQLSGGQRQRVMIAMALACRPDLLIADEPTTALDVTVQAQILDLIVELVEETGMALVLISHDLGVIAETVDDVLVMYGGTVVERAPVERLFERRAHPYAEGLFAARPQLGAAAGKLAAIPGSVPELSALPPGCRFAGRCPWTIEACNAGPPPEIEVEPGHTAACIRIPELARLREPERQGEA
ncbi:MAG: ABC transporter ATP-binding protein [Rhodospirillales bacterium]|nr:ABC transporter ATP-binding protein [Rhodospirillales bacterium]